MNKKDLDFSQAMLTKLRLNREQLSLKDTEKSAPDNEQSEMTDDFSNSIIQKAMERHPGLTEEEARQMMEELGA